MLLTRHDDDLGSRILFQLEPLDSNIFIVAPRRIQEPIKVTSQHSSKGAFTGSTGTDYENLGPPKPSTKLCQSRLDPSSILPEPFAGVQRVFQARHHASPILLTGV